MTRRARLLLAPLLLLGIAAPIALSQPQPPQPRRETVRVPMADGVELATDLHLPPGAGPFPTLLVRTPYNKDGVASTGAAVASRGYACVIQDTRGRFASAGANMPFGGDGWAGPHDGLDTVRWLRRRPWCNGKIGTFGGSALGITQLKLAGTAAEGLLAQAVQVAPPNDYEEMVYRGGVLRKSLVEDWLAGTKHAPEGLAEWLAHPSYDDYWRNRDLTRRWEKTHAPAVHVGGWWDIFAQGSIDAFQGMQEKGGPGAHGAQKLVMGPWTHGIFQDQAGELTFRNAKTPPGAVTDMWKWFDHYLKGEANGIERAPTVTYYVVGDTSDPAAPGNEWRTADRWPPRPVAATPLYLRDDRTLSFQRPDSGSPLTYRYDPANPVPTIGGGQLSIPAGPRDQRPIENRADVLVFTGEKLAAPLEITGRVRARLWAASDGSDTDWLVRLCDVYPDGRSINLCEGVLRARYRRSTAREELLTPGKSYPFDVDLWSISAIVNRGHRLRVHVTSSSAPGYDPNPNTGERLRASDRRRVATNSILVEAKHPSQVILPVPAR